MKDLPIYKAVITEDESLGVDFVAIVDTPAIQRDFMAFAENKSLQRFSAQGEKQVLSGPLMIADLPIFRRSKERGEYYIVFDKQTIEAIVHRFAKQGNYSNVNLMHDNSQRLKDVFMIESFIIDRERGINPPKGYEDLTDGSWFGSYKVDDKSVWDDFIKTGEMKGFSVEGFFSEKIESEPTDEDFILNEIIDVTNLLKSL